MQHENIAIRHPMQSYPFVIADLAISQNDTPLFRVATSAAAKIDATQVTMPWPGSIVGLGVKLSANMTNPSLAFYASVNGVATALGAVVADETDAATIVKPAGEFRFLAGDELGVVYDTDANFLPAATLDAVVDLYVVFDGVNT